MRTRKTLVGIVASFFLLTGCATEPPSITDAAECGYAIDEGQGLLVISEDTSETAWLDGAVCVLEAVEMPTEMQADALTVSSGTGRHDVEWNGFAASYGREGDALVIAISESRG